MAVRRPSNILLGVSAHRFVAHTCVIQLQCPMRSVVFCVSFVASWHPFVMNFGVAIVVVAVVVVAGVGADGAVPYGNC